MKPKTIAYIGAWATIALLLLAAASCTRRVYVPQIRSERIIDTITRVEPDSATLTALFECDSLNQVRIRQLEQYKGKGGAQEVVFKDGELRIETRWRTQYIDRIHEVRDTVTVVDVRTETKEVRRVPAFFWWCFGVALLAVLYGGWRIFKR